MPFSINSRKGARRQGYRDSISTGKDAHKRSPGRSVIKIFQLACRVKLSLQFQNKAKIGYLKTTDKRGINLPVYYLDCSTIGKDSKCNLLCANWRAN